MRRNKWWMRALAAIALLVLALPAWSQAPVRVMEEPRQTFHFGAAYTADLLKGVADSTATAARQTFTNTDKWPGNWGLETWATCKTQVPDSIITLKRDLFVPGGSWTAWYRVDTLLAANFTAGSSVYLFSLLPMGAIKPYSFQICDVQVDGSAACSSYAGHRIYVWP